jgi:hypothetical protein
MIYITLRSVLGKPPSNLLAIMQKRKALLASVSVVLRIKTPLASHSILMKWGLARSFQKADSAKLRFSLCLGIPTFPVFAPQVFVGLSHVDNLLRLAVVEQLLARPQCDRVQVHRL